MKNILFLLIISNIFCFNFSSLNAKAQEVKETKLFEKCIGIRRATHQWCLENCNHIPSFCPKEFCRCFTKEKLVQEQDEKPMQKEKQSYGLNQSKEILGSFNSIQSINSTDSSFISALYLTTWESWDYKDIIQQFQLSEENLVKFNYLSFAQPTNDGIAFTDESPSYKVWCPSDVCPPSGEEIDGEKIFKDIIGKLYREKNVTTLISIGGWSFRNDFGILLKKDKKALKQWALNVKKTVDSFNAKGIDIDFESESEKIWEQLFIEKELFTILREALPSEKYLICFTVGSLALIKKDNLQYLFNPPLSTAYGSGNALSSLIKNWKSIDYINLMTYDGEPNLNPMTAMNLTVQQLQECLKESPENIKNKLFLGMELGSQFGGCTDLDKDWCHTSIEDAKKLSKFTKDNEYKGIFFWTNLDQNQTRTFISNSNKILFN